MRIVVFSDSHGNFNRLHRVVEQREDTQLFLHLGDGEREFDDLAAAWPEKKMLFVRGNCDWASQAKSEELLLCGGKKLFFTHGHLYGVKQGTQRILQRARLLKADICCYGHTHTAYTSCEGGVYILNPGSVAAPRSGKPSYGIIDLTDGGIAIHIATVKT